MSDQPKEEEEGIPVHFVFPDDLHAEYATSVLIQRTKREVYISFFRAKLPTPEVLSIKANQINADTVEERCVAQIIVSPEHFSDIYRVFSQQLVFKE